MEWQQQPPWKHTRAWGQSRGREKTQLRPFPQSATFFLWTSFLLIFKGLLGAPFLCHRVFGLSLVAMQSYAEAGKPGTDNKASPSHSPGIRDLHSSFSHAGAGRRTSLCNWDTNKCQLWWMEVWKCTAEWGAVVESALPAASALLCQRCCRLNVSFQQKGGSKGKQHLRTFLDSFQNFTYPHSTQEQVYWEKGGWRGDVKQVALPVE